MTTAERWITAIEEACSEPDPARCNRKITLLHYSLSEALAASLGRDGGPSFHTWAVWGSRKAGVTIRQEDLGSAVANATKTAIIAGTFIGGGVGMFAGRWLGWQAGYGVGLGAAIGAFSGGCLGRWIAIGSRASAATLVLDGNREVIRDIGVQSARFLELIENGSTEAGREAFFAGLRAGPTEQRGQDRLLTAFRSYLVAFDADDLASKRAAMIGGNCEIVYHEHIRLEPFIRGAMPLVVRRCATQRLMTFEIGDRVLTVGEDIPGVTGPTAARNWANIEERMRYVFALFAKFHNAPEVFSAPYPAMEVVGDAERGSQAR